MHGFPSSYTDGGNTTLAPCLVNTGFCLLDNAVNLLNPGAPFPTNFGGTFPEEFFYWAGEATMPTNAGGEALLVMALEGAFANDLVAAGDQITFGRIRVRVDNLVAGATYRVTTPYGVFNLVAEKTGRRGINFTRDIGGAAGDFVTALNGGIGPFLRWDSGLPIVDNLGNSFIGNPNIAHTVTGSPIGANFFRIDGTNVGGPGVNSIQTNLFSVMGMLNAVAAPVANFTATPTSGNAPLTVNFTSTSTGTITSFAWTFGDGGTASVANPSHVYTTTGSFTVSLTVTGPGGSNTRTAANLINVGVAPGFAIGSITPGVGGQNNRITITGCTPEADVFVLWSTTAGTASVTQRNCTVLTDLAAPQILFSDRARNGSTTISRDVSINGSLRGVSVRLQALDTGNCRKTPVFVELF